MPSPQTAPNPQRHSMLCCHQTCFKWLQKMTYPKKSCNLLCLKYFLCYKTTQPLKSLCGWVVPGKDLDHSPTILGNVRILGSVRIVGESINKFLIGILIVWVFCYLKINDKFGDHRFITNFNTLFLF